MVTTNIIVNDPFNINIKNLFTDSVYEMSSSHERKHASAIVDIETSNEQRFMSTIQSDKSESEVQDLSKCNTYTS